MVFFRMMLLALVSLSVTACSSKFRTYNGPEVTAIEVHKADRKMYLLHENSILETYDVALGGVPIGPKQFEGDGKTPEGTYLISHKNPESNYHLSLGINYPNTDDVAFAAQAGKLPGGDIFIHGGPTRKVNRRDWTAGCIAVTDKQMEVIYSMVKPGTRILLVP